MPLHYALPHTHTHMNQNSRCTWRCQHNPCAQVPPLCTCLRACMINIDSFRELQSYCCFQTTTGTCTSFLNITIVAVKTVHFQSMELHFCLFILRSRKNFSTYLCYIPWQCRCIQSPLCRVHPCRANTERNRQSAGDIAHRRQWPPLSGPICSSGLRVWCHSRTNPGFESFPPGQPVHFSVVRSVWWAPGDM